MPKSHHPRPKAHHDFSDSLSHHCGKCGISKFLAVSFPARMCRPRVSKRVAKARQHRWSGWPGAWCLDCGIEDPLEQALADNQLTDEGRFVSPSARKKYRCLPCPSPGSKQFDPYARKDEERELLNMQANP